MSEVLATSPALSGEAPTVEGRLAGIIAAAEVRVDDYRLSDRDRARVVAALRGSVNLQEQIAMLRDVMTDYLALTMKATKMQPLNMRAVRAAREAMRAALEGTEPHTSQSSTLGTKSE